MHKTNAYIADRDEGGWVGEVQADKTSLISNPKIHDVLLNACNGQVYVCVVQGWLLFHDA